MNRTPASAGLTLIEVMMVVALIGIMAAIALPAFATYSIRAKTAEVLLAANSCRNKITAVFQYGPRGGYPANRWGCESVIPDSPYVSTVATTASGQIIVTSVVPGAEGTLWLSPTDSTGRALSPFDIPAQVDGWTCAGGSTSIPAQYLPDNCRG